jgi:hypothetical protein
MGSLKEAFGIIGLQAPHTGEHSESASSERSLDVRQPAAHLAAAPAPLIDDQTSAALRQVCPSCGGSGMLRLGDQRFRTCLDCLGQGHMPVVGAATTVAEVLQLDSRRLIAAASSAAAR